MTTPATPKAKSSRKSSKPKAATRRIARSKTAAAGKIQPASGNTPHEKDVVRRRSSQSEQLIILVGALAFGLLGLAFHFLWIVSILLMALLLGQIATEVRSRHGRSMVAEMVNEAKVVVEEIKKPVSTGQDDDESNDETESNPS